MKEDELKEIFRRLSEKTDDNQAMKVHEEALQMIFKFSIENNLEIQGYDLKKLVNNPSKHWNEIKDMLSDIRDLPGMADARLRKMIDFWSKYFTN